MGSPSASEGNDRRILIVVDRFAPDTGTNVLRWRRFAGFLAGRGWQVQVVCSGARTEKYVIDREVQVLRFGPRRSFRIWLEGLLRRLAEAVKRKRGRNGDRVGRSPRRAIGARQGKAAEQLVRRILWGVDLVQTVAFGKCVAKRVASAITRSGTRPDVIVGSFPSLFGFATAKGISARLGVPWVADYRDPFAEFYFLPFRDGGIVHRVLRRMERDYNASAAGIVTINREMSAIVGAAAGPRVTEIPNCFEKMPSGRADPASRSGDSMEILYTGIVTPHHTLEEFLQGSAEFFRVGKCRFRYYGPSAEHVHRMWERLIGSTEAAFISSSIDRDRVIEEQCRAEVLLVLGFKPGRSSRCVVTGKILEYIESGRPILAVTGSKEDELYRMMADTGVGICVTNGDEVRNVISGLAHRAWQFPRRNVEKIREYTLERCGARLAEFLETIVLSPE